MKKLLTGLFASAIALLFTVPVLAANTTTYKIDELKIRVEIPSELYTFTRDVDEKDSRLAQLGMNKESLLDTMTSTDTYYAIIPSNQYYAVLISYQDYNGYGVKSNINDCSESELEELSEGIKSTYEENGTPCSISIIDDNPQIVFLKYHIENNGTNNMIQYMTFFDHHVIYFTLQSYVGEVTSEMEKVISDMVKSTVFDSLLNPIKFSVYPTEFYSSEAGVKLTVPGGWGQSEEVVEQGYTKIEYVNQAGNTMLFGYKDIYAELPLDEQVMYSRDEINCAYFDEGDLKNKLKEIGAEVSHISYRYFDHIKYFKVNLSKDTFINDTNTIMYIMIFHGTMYMFDFDGYEESIAHEDFISLVASAKYDEISTTNVFRNLMGIPANEEGIILIAGLTALTLLALLIYMVPIIIYRYAIKKAPFAKKKAIKIMLIYGLCFCSIMIILALAESSFRIIAVTTILWSFVNYAILKGGKAKATPQNSFTMAGGTINLGYYNPPGAVYPTEPFQPASSDVATSPNAQATVTSNAQYCKYCGSPLESGSVFCPRCGARVI